MRNQFIYIDKVTIPGKVADEARGIEATEPKILEKKNSFNVDKVIRVLALDEGGILVLLDDLHERWDERRKVKNGRPTTARERDTFQSEIRLSQEDAERFFKLTNVEND